MTLRYVNQSETRMTASVLNLTRTKHTTGSKERYLSGQNAACEFSGKSLLSSYKATLIQQLNGEKRQGMKWK